MSGWAPGQPALVVEHDDRTRRPKEGGQVFPATVKAVTGAYVLAEVPALGRDGQFWRDSGWEAWTGSFRWEAWTGSFRWRLKRTEETHD